MKSLLKLMMVSLLVTQVAFSQKTIIGVVSDDQGMPLPGATVLEKGANNGVSTDFDGNYSIEVAEGSVLEFSFLGYITQSISESGQDTIDVQLLEDVSQLEEVVVTGYGSQAKKTITTSVASIKPEDFNQGNINSPEQLLAGKVAGLSIARAGADPNGQFVIRLRGLSSLGANTSPLIVIDGLAGGTLQSVDPNDIASIDILKDGGAAAIYGTRGSSGVILITTKKGKANQSEFTFNSYLSVESRARSIEVANATQFASLPNVTSVNVLGSDTNWLDAISQDAVGQVYGVSSSGGTDNTSYRASFNYRDFNGVQINSGFNQLNGRIAVDHSALNDRLKFTASLAGSVRNEDIGFRTAFRYATVYNPTAPTKNPDGSYFESGGFDTFNPLAIVEQNTSQAENNNMTGGMKLEYELFDGFKAAVYYGYQSDKRTNIEKYSKDALYRGGGKNGLVRWFDVKLVTKQTDFTITYDVDLTDGLNLNILGGTSYQDFSALGSSLIAGDFISDSILDNLGMSGDVANGLAVAGSTKRISKLFAVFGRVNLDFDDTYYVSATIRPEQHDRFGENNQWGTFGAVSAGVNITNLSDGKFGPFDYLKFRGSWGLTGNIPSFDLIGPAQATVGASGNYFNNGAFIPAFAPSSNPNPDLQWEEKTEIDFGFDFALLDNKLTGTVDYYTRTTSNLLRNQPVPVPPNLFGLTLTNVGEIENSGIELSLEYKAILNSGLEWTPAMNLATYKNELKSLESAERQYVGSLGSPGLNAATPIIIEPGRPIGDIYVPEFKGINADGTWNVTMDKSEFIVAGNGLPDFSLNFYNTFKYNNWDLNFLLRGVFGHSLVNATRTFYEQPNVAPTYNVLASSFGAETFGLTINESRLSTLYVEKADFIKLDNITIGLNLAGFGESLGIESSRLYLSGQNLFTISGYKGVDPEVRYTDNGQEGNGDFITDIDDPLVPGIDRRNTWFTTKTVVLGLNVKF
jgi:TonB-linked SusC/RagA family outer membrane protein